ncbi:LptA/OstA family protein [Treponema sp.]|uniref:LptA/OstA family protein n=1 Tax=Treponema sp. TaxID=166 RepID=UPI00388D285D
MKKYSKCILALFLAFSSLAFCEKITFSANKMSGVAGNKNSVTTLKGNAKVNTKTMIINADYIELSGKDFRMIKAEGNISGKNTESNLDFTCGKLTYDRETKIATLENDVKLVDLDNDVVAQAQIIEYNQNSEIAVMQIKINLTQKDNVCTSAYAIYKKTEQILEMSGNPKIIQNGDTFRAQTIKLDMDSQEITLSGRVKGSVVTTAAEENDETTAEPTSDGEIKVSEDTAEPEGDTNE